MNKVLFQIKDNKLLVQIKKRVNQEKKNLMNTNVINQNELLFSDEYIIANKKIMNSFIHELVANYNLDTLIIKESSIALYILDIIANIKNIKNLYLLEETILTYKICEKIINTNTINFVSLYNIPTFLLEMLDRENIKVSSRNEILFSSNFMKENKLENFSSLYYKAKITLTFPFSKEDEEDFLSFININKYLKQIYINRLNKNDIENILDILYSMKLKNIKIYIDQNIHDIELIEYLKKINKKNSKTNKILFKINYSQEYLENNFMSQVHLNTIKLCIFMSLIFVSSLVVYVFATNYISMQKVDEIKDDIMNQIAEYIEPDDEIIDENDGNSNENDYEINVGPEQNMTTTKKITKDMKALLEINSETVGWLKVNNTNIDYPVVQHSDNEYYLKKNFKNENDKSGWVYADYRADMKNLSDNTIIFGHNMYYSGVMFGTLYKAKYSNWYTKQENQIIEFNTLYEKLKWKIFSIYIVPNTNDYLIADFTTEEKFQHFLDLITERSIYDFNTPVATNDKILTLSTCSDNGKNRLVIHAVLITN